MNSSKEVVINVHWEGPFEWEERKDRIKGRIKDGHVLYQIYGLHHLYGRDVLLYIGSSVGKGSERDINTRLKEHSEWIEWEPDKVKIYLGSLGRFSNWKDWEEDEEETYGRADLKLVEMVEALLIYANQPCYNSRNKVSANQARNIRIFNTGRYGQLLPEVSYWYYEGDLTENDA